MIVSLEIKFVGAILDDAVIKLTLPLEHSVLCFDYHTAFGGRDKKLQGSKEKFFFEFGMDYQMKLDSKKYRHKTIDP